MLDFVRKNAKGSYELHPGWKRKPEVFPRSPYRLLHLFQRGGSPLKPYVALYTVSGGKINPISLLKLTGKNWHIMPKGDAGSGAKTVEFWGDED